MWKVPAKAARPHHRSGQHVVSQTQFIGLFPIPVVRVSGLLDEDLIHSIVARTNASERKETNAYSEGLSHSPITGTDGDDLLARVGDLVMPSVVQFGEVLFGEALNWQIKEIWSNVLETGGRQAVHTHANSFISGVVYLTASHPSANIVFHKSLGGTDYIFSNHNKNAAVNAYNGSKWAMPEIVPGDLVLFPSYLLHEVPVNKGPRRMSVAFNAIPDRLDNLGYAVRFS
jgi:uncharacterized protein (TIGR02466 family)